MFYFLASQEDVDCKPFTVHWMGQLSLVPRHPGNPCTVDCHTAFPAANRKWCHCFSVQVNSRFFTVSVSQAPSYCLMTYCVLVKRKLIKKTDNTCQMGLAKRDESSCHFGEFCLLSCVLLASFDLVTHSSPDVSWKGKIAR